MVKLSNEEFIDKITSLVASLKKRIQADDIDVRIDVKDDLELSISGFFAPNVRVISESYIEIFVCPFNHMAGKPTSRWRRWKASLITTFIHEYSHYILFKNLLTLTDRKRSVEGYTNYKYYRDRDESETWDLAISLLKKYGYLRSTTLQKELKTFVMPEGYRFPRGTYKNARIPSK